jgi:peptide/nickel transport system substrate-binding protein
MRRARRCFMGLGLACLATVLASCGSGGAKLQSSGGKIGSTLQMAFEADPQPLDPDTYYLAEGEVIMVSTYEGLLRYKPNSNVLEPLLATSWKTSPDGKTYTFTLRHGVRFSDGSPFNSAAAKESFERRKELKGGPSYMVADVTKIDTPGPYTLVIHLDRPVAPFLSYLASPFGPLMSSPTAIKAHRTAGDPWASKWFGTHSAGTGPMVLSSVVHGSHYTLTRNPHYWGQQSGFATVNISIVPNFETQRLELEQGQLDVVTHGLTTQDVIALQKNPNVQVKEFPALDKLYVGINPRSAVFGNPAVRAALRADLNNTALTHQVMGPDGIPSTNFLPNGMLPNGMASDVPKYNPSLLAHALAPYKGKTVRVGWTQDSISQNLADIIQTRLSAAGVNATIDDVSSSVLGSLPTSPKQRPDLLVIDNNPDSVAADTWMRIYNITNGPVNWLQGSVPTGDKLLDEGARQATQSAANHFDAEAAIAYRNSNYWLSISDVYDTIVVRKGITGFDHQLPYLYNLRVASLRPS